MAEVVAKTLIFKTELPAAGISAVAGRRALREDASIAVASSVSFGIAGTCCERHVSRSTYAVAALMTICVLMLSWQSARSREKDPHEMTALGVISENVREIYAREVEVCYNEAGKASRGPKFLDCLQRHVRSQKDALDAIYDARMSYLGSYSPELAASLQHAQAAWLQFRDANCAFIRSTARASYADEAFQNCILRTTIYRRVQLRWLVGD
jgi:uncharacterized protein YecT (DUF1311 family)